MDQKILTLLLASVVVLSGCTGLTRPSKTTVAANGIVVSGFAPDFADLVSGEKSILILSVQNVGQHAADNLVALLFGLNLGGTEWSTADANPQSLAKLQPAEPSIDFPGESFDFQWTVASPSNLQVDNSYTAQARVLYTYGTTAIGTLRLVSFDYVRSLPSAQAQSIQNTAGVIQESSTGAPITISFSAGNRPLLVRSATDNTYILQVILTNTGSGEPFDPSTAYSGGLLSLDALRKVNVNIVTDLPGFSCPSLGGTTGQVTLAKSESKAIYCQFTVADASSILNTRDFAVTVDLGYGYYSDTSTTINVHKAATIV